MSVQIATDLRPLLLPARDQGSRPTCMAFAASDAHAFVHGAKSPFSTEYAFYHAVQRFPPNDPAQGVPMSVMLEVLKNPGQPYETAWSYRDVLPSPLSGWRPPLSTGMNFRHAFNPVAVGGESALEIVDRKEVVIVILEISEQFFHLPDPEAIRIRANDPDAGAHALVGVGTGRSGSERFLLARNSWGYTWGFDGHIWIAENYLSSRLYEMAVRGGII